MDNFGLRESDIEYIHAQLAVNKKIEGALIYGSRAMGRQRNGSDIDLTLEGELLKIEDIMKLNGVFYDSPLPYKFDISIRHGIDNKNLLATIPYDALLEADGNNAFVFVPTKNNHVKKEAVVIESFNNDNVVIKSGLENITTIVVSNSAFLNEKSIITIIK